MSESELNKFISIFALVVFRASFSVATDSERRRKKKKTPQSFNFVLLKL